jgi:hypothetical protein
MRSPVAIDELAAHHALTTLPEAWLDLAHGRISADQAAAAMQGHEPDELIERSKVLFLPCSPADEERQLEALLQAHFPEPVRRVVPRMVPRWAQAGVLALVAAALLLLLVPFVGRPPAFDGGYALTLSSGYLEMRDEPGTAQGVTRYREGQRIEIVARPQQSVAVAVGVEAFAVASGGSTQLRLEPEINEHGVVTIVGTPESLGLGVGRWELMVVVGPREHLPGALEDVRKDAEAPYDVLTVEVEIVNAPDPPSP